MKIAAQKINIFKIKNRKGYAALCLNHLTEGKTLFQVHDRMLKALRRNGISVANTLKDIRSLVKKEI